MSFTMPRVVYLSGIYNAGLAVTLCCPPAYQALGLHFPAPFWGYLVAAFVAYTSAALILAARNLRQRASFVYWEALLRFATAALIVPQGLFGDVGRIAVPLGLADLGVGLVYLIGIPRALGVAPYALLWDQLPQDE